MPSFTFVTTWIQLQLCIRLYWNFVSNSHHHNDHHDYDSYDDYYDHDHDYDDPYDNYYDDNHDNDNPMSHWFHWFIVYDEDWMFTKPMSAWRNMCRQYCAMQHVVFESISGML